MTVLRNIPSLRPSDEQEWQDLRHHNSHRSRRGFNDDDAVELSGPTTEVVPLISIDRRQKLEMNIDHSISRNSLTSKPRGGKFLLQSLECYKDTQMKACDKYDNGTPNIRI